MLRASGEWPITPGLFRALLRRHREGAQDALPDLVSRMTPIIRKRAWRFARHAEVEDLFQQGVVLLLEVLPKIRTNGRAAPIQYAARYISTGLHRYCVIACPVSRPLTLTHSGRLRPAARIIASGDLDWVYDPTKLRDIPPVAPEWEIARGEQNGNARLTSKKVEEIRRRYAAGGVTQRELAEEIGVCRRTIGGVVRRKFWRAVGT